MTILKITVTRLNEHFNKQTIVNVSYKYSQVFKMYIYIIKQF